VREKESNWRKGDRPIVFTLKPVSKEILHQAIHDSYMRSNGVVPPLRALVFFGARDNNRGTSVLVRRAV